MASRRRVIAHFDDWARVYDECSLRPLYDAAHRAVLDAARCCAVRPKRMLDLGCGTGRLLERSAVLFPRAVLVGADLSAGMLRAAAYAGCGERRFVCGAAEELPFSDAVFDLVFSTISLRHWADLHAGLAEIHRVLTPGGRLIVATVIEIRRRRRRHVDAVMSAADLVSAGLVIDDIQRVAGFGPVPAVTIVTAHRAAATA